jgi:APA family basic amino acid/polyamine antiporter
MVHPLAARPHGAGRGLKDESREARRGRARWAIPWRDGVLVMSETHGSAPEPRRALGLPSAAALVVANMIGAGVFTTSGFALADLGRRDAVLLAWAVGGGLALCGALSYGALARRIPESGGEYTFLSRTVHPLAGFLAGWVSLLAGFTAPIAAAAHGLEAYAAAALGWEGGARGAPWLGTAAIALAGWMHGRRLRPGVVLQNAAVALKLVLIAGFVGLGVLLRPERLADAGPASGEVEIGAFAVTLVWISFSYSGWNAAVYVAGEVRDPERNLARALWLATAAVTAVYLALNAVFLFAAPREALAGRAEVGAVAAEALGGPALRAALAGLVALALFTSVSSMVMAGPRVYARMADDGLFPRALRFAAEAPRAAVALQVALAVAVLWISTLRELLGYIGFTLGLCAAGTVAGLLRLRAREGAARVPIRGHPFVPGLFVAGTLAAAAFMALRQPAEAGLGLLTVAAGLPLYALARRRAGAPAS